jgi:hypothetical protein
LPLLFQTTKYGWFDSVALNPGAIHASFPRFNSKKYSSGKAECV